MLHPYFSSLESPILAVTQGSYSLSALQLLVTNLHASEDPDCFGVFVTNLSGEKHIKSAFKTSVRQWKSLCLDGLSRFD
jgi:phosphoribosylpyrophosphate synthetase